VSRRPELWFSFYPSPDNLKDGYLDAIDRRTLGGKFGDIPIERAFRNAHLDSPRCGCDRARLSAGRLQEH
jgi:hypothetical protein